MSNKQYRPESNEPIGSPSRPATNPGGLPSSAKSQVKGTSRVGNGRAGWPLESGNKGGWIGDPKGLKVTPKTYDTPRGGSKPNSGNHAKKQGWAI